MHLELLRLGYCGYSSDLVYELLCNFMENRIFPMGGTSSAMSNTIFLGQRPLTPCKRIHLF